jgi:hypothetical protein
VGARGGDGCGGSGGGLGRRWVGAVHSGRWRGGDMRQQMKGSEGLRGAR